MENKKQASIFAMGEIKENLIINNKIIDYPVLNERAIRAGSGIMFVLATFAFVNAFFTDNFLYLKIVVVFFFIDFAIKVFINPKFSPTSVVARFIVRNQTPEFVGAIQKRFAWSLGLFMSAVMIVLLFVLNMTGTINLTMCAICLMLMFFETSFGICLGCDIYYGLKKLNIIKSEQEPRCPGGSCDIT